MQMKQSSLVGVKQLENLGEGGTLVEGDSFTVTQWPNGSVCPWSLLDKIEEIRQIIRKKNLVVSHILRSANKRAVSLAKEEVNLFLSRLFVALLLRHKYYLCILDSCVLDVPFP